MTAEDEAHAERRRELRLQRAHLVERNEAAIEARRNAAANLAQAIDHLISLVDRREHDDADVPEMRRQATEAINNLPTLEAEAKSIASWIGQALVADLDHVQVPAEVEMLSAQLRAIADDLDNVARFARLNAALDRLG